MARKELVSDYSKKLKHYKNVGKATSRSEFEAGVPELLWIDKNKPYGNIPLYDDMTENDLLRIYRKYKKVRIVHLRERGIKTRKHITENSSRDYMWYEKSKKYSVRDRYKRMAKNWAGHNRKEVRKMMLQYVWNHKNECISQSLENMLCSAKSSGMIFDTFANKIKSANLRVDLERYIEFHLPRLIRSAVNRYEKMK